MRRSSGDEIEKRVAGDLDELVRSEELFDLLAWPAADKGETVADRFVFGAPASVVERLRRGADISLAVDDDEPSTSPVTRFSISLPQKSSACRRKGSNGASADATPSGATCRAKAESYQRRIRHAAIVEARRTNGSRT